jgi:ribosomal-protein-alanine N-acetyltransferase
VRTDAGPVRAIAAADLAPLAALHQTVFTDDGWPETALSALFESPGVFGFAAAAAAGPAAFILARVAADDSEILTLAVAEAFRRCGLGRALLQAAMAEARRRGARRLVLEVAESNASAIALYAGQGCRPIGRRRRYYRRTDGSGATDGLLLSVDLR